MNNQILSVNDIASAVAGAGLTKINDNLNIALMLIGAGIALKVLVAVLNRFNIPLAAKK